MLASRAARWVVPAKSLTRWHQPSTSSPKTAPPSPQSQTNVQSPKVPCDDICEIDETKGALALPQGRFLQLGKNPMSEQTLKKLQCVSASTLKWIAMATMIIDHVAYMFVYNWYVTLGDAAIVPIVHNLYYAMRIIGRAAFIIFAFELAQGARHTHSFPRYFSRLAIFAIISQIPFWLAFYPNNTAPLAHLNVMVTLLLALIAPCIGEILRRKGYIDSIVKTACTVVCLLICLGVIAISNKISLDYGAYGIALVTLFYLFADKPVQQIIAACFVTYVYALINPATHQIWACIPIVLVCLLYNGKPGHINKWIAYGFYPGHMLILKLIALL